MFWKAGRRDTKHNVKWYVGYIPLTQQEGICRNATIIQLDAYY